MDVVNVLKINKHPTLYKRFPEILSVTNTSKRQANWLVYGKHITTDNIDAINGVALSAIEIVAAWKVGSYDAILIASELTLEHQQRVLDQQLDFAYVSDIPDLSMPGIVVLDMDSTAIEIECIDEIAILAGVGEEVAVVTERAMLGELDFEQSLRQRVATLAGADAAILTQVRDTLPLMPELPQLIATLYHYGWQVAIASGGFTYFSEHLKQQFNLVFATSNTLEIIDGKLTGKVIGDVIDAKSKADILLALAEEFDIEPHNTVAVGDGANDLVMMDVAGLGVAYHAKLNVEQQADVAIRHADLGAIICILSASLAEQRLAW
ncbi:phosphoserine phosphatase [Photobacterium carnosum]|uniref:phosphoserine phosphatase n=1 Tax=Photobacterium carnosum TaxID=2023717 RepID=UPI001C920048|nr:phosphoserine phosphatase [Photobacterium carnosum]MBY3788178.1 phosphoserine phosphatase [Photobacterium carnosum]MCD9533344.1 phosphoserine phosphatase [Photobacterium carnosum]